MSDSQSATFDVKGYNFANDMISFLNESCTAFHAVQATKERLLAAGYQQILEKDEWMLEPGGKYFFTRAATTCVAFTIPNDIKESTTTNSWGFSVLGAHSDSPCLRIKAVPCMDKQEYLMLNTQPYGGGLWHTWFDRELGIAGRVLLKDPTTNAIVSELIRCDKPVARIPNLAIHLTRGDGETPGVFKPNLQEHAKAIFTMKHNKKCRDMNEGDLFHPELIELVREYVPSNMSTWEIVDMELQLIDVVPSCLGGNMNEFLLSGRLDNLCSSYQCMRAIIDASTTYDMKNVTSTTTNTPLKQNNIHVSVMFDHEEVGSASAQGAGSQLFMDTLRRITDCLGDKSHQSFMRTLRNSLVVSVDMAHALHPNYTHKHCSTMAPKINKGMVIKHNANQRYATSSVSATMFRRFAQLQEIPVQEFAIRSDGACGSTIGPIISTLTGILTVDVGTPQYSMHSIREMMGSDDAYIGYMHLLGVLLHHPTVANEMKSLDI